MNLTVPGAVAVLESAFSELLRGSPPGFESFEASAKRIANACCAEAMGRALEARDRELASSRPAGSRSHSRRRRTLATLSGDVSFTRTVLLDAAGSTLYPPDEELGLPLGDRVSPAARAFLVTCGADVPLTRTARLMAMAGGSEVSGVTVMNSLRGAVAAMAVGQRESARALYEDGVTPEAEGSAEHVLIEADGTYVRMRGGLVRGDRGAGGRAIADALRRSGPDAPAQLIEGMAGRGECREGRGAWPPTCAATRPGSGAGRRWARWRPSGSTSTRSAWGRSRAPGRPRGPTRWRGCAAGCSLASACRAGRGRGPSPRRGGRAGTGGSGGSCPRCPEAAYNPRGRVGSTPSPARWPRWAPTSGSGRPAEASRVVRQHQFNADRGGSSG